MREYHKLVRDRIPEIIASKGEKGTFRTLDQADFSDALFQKLLEEATEVVGAKDDHAELSKELADISEVIHAICAISGISLEEVEAMRVKRKDERGGFEKRVMLESTQ